MLIQTKEREREESDREKRSESLLKNIMYDSYMMHHKKKKDDKV